MKYLSLILIILVSGCVLNNIDREYYNDTFYPFELEYCHSFIMSNALCSQALLDDYTEYTSVSDMFKELPDTIARYFDSSDGDIFLDQFKSHGGFVGIGVLIDSVEFGAQVKFVYSGSNADESGLNIGDIIFACDDEILAGNTILFMDSLINRRTNVQKIIAWAALGDTVASLALVHTGDIIYSHFFSYPLTDISAYISISDFRVDTYESLKLTMEELAVSKLIIDLRGNRGGMHCEAELCSGIIPGKDYEEIILLIDSLTAGAAELFITKIIDFPTVKTYGITTSGVSAAEIITTTPNYNTLLVTDMELVDMSGNSWCNIGITPNVYGEILSIAQFIEFNCNMDLYSANLAEVHITMLRKQYRSSLITPLNYHVPLLKRLF